MVTVSFCSHYLCVRAAEAASRKYAENIGQKLDSWVRKLEKKVVNLPDPFLQTCGSLRGKLFGNLQAWSHASFETARGFTGKTSEKPG